MADIAPGLNFRIGADVKGVQKAIREAEKSLRGAVSSFSSIGNSLSLALTAPIAAFTGASIKAAGDMEALRLALEGTMKDAGRSVNEAKAELDALRVAALAPGLDFEQAVRGSIRLQSVGKSAEEAREIITQLANALALSGGTADQLDGVTKQFTQMIGKGKIMQEDLTIILENMPALAKVMQDTFGSSNAEMLRKMGVSVEDFIAKLTDGMAKLPRAQGGIANAIVNAQNAIKQAIASVGEEINKTFNVTGALNSFASWVSGLAKGFKDLDEGTKRMLGGFVVFAATLGPAFKLMQGGVWIAGQLHLAFLSLQKSLAQGMAGQAIPSLIAKWRALDFAMKASVIGGIAAVVLAAAAAFTVMSKDMSAAAQAARQVEKTQQDAAASIALERAEIESLTAIAKNETASKAERMNALNRLIEISPEYRKALKGEAIDTAALDKVTNQLVDSMLRAATARKAIEDIAEIDNKLRNLKESADPTFWQTAGNAFLSLGNANAFAGRQVQSSIGNYNEQREALEATREKLLELARANVETFTQTGKNAAATKDLGEKSTQAKTSLDAYLESVKKNEEAQRKWNEARAAMGVAPLESLKLPNLEVPQLSLSGMGAAMSGTFSNALESLKTIGGTVTTALTPAQALIQGLTRDFFTLDEAFKMVAETMTTNGDVFQKIGFGVVEAMTGLADAGKGIEEMAGGILQSLKKIIGGLIKTGVASIVTKALLSTALNPFAALALGAASGALAQGLFNSLINKVKVPALAEGGVLTSPRLVMAGEYPGARANPEIVTPENKMRDVFSEVMSKMGGTGGQLVARISGDDLLFVVEKAKTKANRTR